MLIETRLCSLNQFLHIRVLGAAQGIDRRPTQAGAEMLKQSNSCDQFDPNGL